jgi:hypothetical protein
MLAITLAVFGFAAGPLSPAQTVDVPSPGRFDYMAYDKKYQRVLATHTGPGTLVVYSKTAGKVMEVKTGVVNGVYVSDKLGRILWPAAGRS